MKKAWKPAVAIALAVLICCESFGGTILFVFNAAAESISYSSWSDWSAWQDSYVSDIYEGGQKIREVQTRSVDQYNYYHYSLYKSNGSTSTVPIDMGHYNLIANKNGYSPAISEAVHGYTSDSELTYETYYIDYYGNTYNAYVGHSCCNTSSGTDWWFQTSEFHTTKTQYRYRTRTATYTYTITYNLNGGTGTFNPQTKTKTVSVGGTTSNDLTLRAGKPTKSYTITYNANGGSVSPASKSFSCTFNNWKDSDTTPTTYPAGGIYKKNKDTTMTAQWTDPKAVDLATPVRDGYTFDGWFTDANGGTQLTSSTTISQSQTVYAHWTLKTYTIQYKANGGSGQPENQTKTHGSDLTLSSKKPTKSYTLTYNVNGGVLTETSTLLNCVFNNWIDENGDTYLAGGKYTKNQPATLTAQWTNPKAGELPIPSHTEYEFAGWYDAQSGGNRIADTTTISANKVIYAHWTNVQSPTGSISSTNNVAASQTVTLTLSDNGVLAGYYWGTNQTYTSNSFVATTNTSATKTVSNSGTYYFTVQDSAGRVSENYSIVFRKITLNTNDGTVSPEKLVIKNGNSVALPTPTRPGFTFNGWNTASDFSGTSYAGGASYKASSNVPLYAKWTDTTKPTGTITSTNNVAIKQTATLTLSDNFGIAGYYWGSNSDYSQNTYTAIDGAPTSKTVTKEVVYGVYYLTVKDTTGNVSTSVNKWFLKTTLDANGGSVSPAYVITMQGNSFKVPTPSRSGYTFKHWSTESNGNGTTYADGASLQNITSSSTLYAQWIDSENPTGTISSTNNVAASQTVTLTLADNDSLAGYYWGNNSDYTKNTYTATTSASVTKTVSAAGTYYFTVKDAAGNVSTTYSIVFRKITLTVNGGTVSPTSIIIKHNNSIALPKPTRSGYTFNGWNTASDFTGTSYAAGASYKASANVTLYAQWTDSQAPTVSISSTNNVTPTQTVTISMSDNAGIAGYYWGANSDYSQNAYTAISGSPVTSTATKTVSSADTYYATVKDTTGNVKTVSATFFNTILNANGGSVAPENVRTMSGQSFNIPTPERQWYTFKGWNTKQNGSGTTVSATAFKPTANTTIYAQWEETVLTGSCGASASYSLNLATGVLTISGTGDLNTINSASETPWAPYRSNITTLVIEDGIQKLTGGSFNGCTNLTSITFSDSVTQISSSTFANCTSLVSVTIPKNVDYVAGSAFSGCSKLTTINVASGSKNYESVDGVLYTFNKKSLAAYPCGKESTSLTVPSGTIKIQSYALRYCKNLTSVSLPNSLTEINTQAFLGCTNLKSITVPPSVTTIGANALGYSNTSLQIVSGFSLTCYENTAGLTYAQNNSITYSVIALASISIDLNATKTEYYVGDSLDTSEVTVNCVFVDGASAAIKTGFTCSSVNLNKVCKKRVQVTYLGKTAYFTVSVVDPPITSISVKTNPTKTTYKVGEKLDPTGLVLKAVYSNGTTGEIVTGYTTSYDFSSVGSKMVTVRYTIDSKTVETSFTVTVVSAPTATLGSTNATSGQTISIPITISNNSGFMGIKLTAQYDASVFTPISVTSGELVGNGTIVDSIGASESGEIDIVFTGTDNVSNNGILAYLNFSISATFTGTQTIQLSYSEADTFNSDWDSVYFLCQSGMIQIEKASSVHFYGDNTEATPGSTITVPIKADNMTGIRSFVVRASFDSGVLSLKQVVPSTSGGSLSTENGSNGEITINWEGENDLTGDVIAQLVFDVGSTFTGTELTIQCLSAVKNGAAVTDVLCNNIMIDYLDPTANPITVYSEVIGSKPGEDVQVPIYIRDNHGIMGFKIKVAFDASLLEAKQITNGNVLTTGTLANNIGTNTNEFTVVWNSTDDVIKNGLLFTITFTVKNNASYTTIPLTLTYEQEDTYNSSWNDIHFIFNDIVINRIYTAQIAHWCYGLDGKGTNSNNGNNAIRLAVTTKDFTYSSGITLTEDDRIPLSALPNGVQVLSNGFSSSSFSNSWDSYSFPQTFTNVIKDVVIQINYRLIDYSIIYDLDGGTLATANPSRYNVVFGASFTNSPTRNGYTFAGWTIDGVNTVTGVNEAELNDNVFVDDEGLAGGLFFEAIKNRMTGNITVKALWTDSEKPTGTISASNRMDSCQTVTLTLSDNEGLSGYYWGTSATYFDNAFVAVEDAPKSITLSFDISSAQEYYLVVKDVAGNVSAVVSKRFYQITLDGNGGVVAPESILIMEGNQFILPVAEKYGFDFFKWSTNADGSGAEYAANFGYDISSNLTVYAQWKEIAFTLSGDVNADGVVNLKDVVILQRYLAGGWNVVINDYNSDVNKDGIVNVKDVVLLSRYLAGGWNVTLI